MQRIYFVVFFCVSLLSCDAGNQCESFTRKTYFAKEVSGKVKEAYFQYFDGGRGTPTIKWMDGTITYVPSTNLICYLIPGDSVVKRSGSLKYSVFRGSDVEIFFPDCGALLILDSNITKNNPGYGMDCGKRKE